MKFIKYQHVERLGTTEVEGILDGLCYVFPKIDGTNASVWSDEGVVQAGSRNRQLSIERDNAGFYEYVLKDKRLRNFFKEHPNKRLYGEWLVPHSLKTYRDTAWREFYVFDVIDEYGEYIEYEDYKPMLDKYSIEYIPPLFIVDNPTEERISKALQINDYLIEDGKGYGEGVVVKNYDFINKYGRTTWAKVVTSEFKEKNRKSFGVTEVKEKKEIEREIVNKYVSLSMCEKVKAKIENEKGDWQSKYIPRLLNTVYYDLIREESWNFIKEHKNPNIDFKKIMKLTFSKTKELLNL